MILISGNIDVSKCGCTWRWWLASFVDQLVFLWTDPKLLLLCLDSQAFGNNRVFFMHLPTRWLTIPIFLRFAPFWALHLFHIPVCFGLLICFTCTLPFYRQLYQLETDSHLPGTSLAHAGLPWSQRELRKSVALFSQHLHRQSERKIMPFMIYLFWQ